MARKNRTPEENARREKIRELLQMANIGSMDDIQNLFKETIAEFMENGLEAELDDELGYSRYDYRNKSTDNSRNGHSSKTLRTSFGDVEVSVPRDQKGEFEPQILKKNQTSISQDIEEKILSMYAKGMTTGDIEAHIQDIYGISVSDSTVSRITDKILPIVREWQQRPLEGIYAVVFLDAIHYHVRSEGQIVKKAVYIAIGIDLDGRKDVLGMWVVVTPYLPATARHTSSPRRSVSNIRPSMSNRTARICCSIAFPTSLHSCAARPLPNRFSLYTKRCEKQTARRGTVERKYALARKKWRIYTFSAVCPL